MHRADIIVHFRTSPHSKFQIRNRLKLTSAERRLVRMQADVNFSQSQIWNLEWSKVLKCTIISAHIQACGANNKVRACCINIEAHA